MRSCHGRCAVRYRYKLFNGPDRNTLPAGQPGNRTGDVARKYELSDGRISQLRKELHLSWQLMMLS